MSVVRIHAKLTILGNCGWLATWYKE